MIRIWSYNYCFCDFLYNDADFFLTHCTTFFKFFVSKDLSEFISCTKYLVQYLVRIKVQKNASYYKHNQNNRSESDVLQFKACILMRKKLRQSKHSDLFGDSFVSSKATTRIVSSDSCPMFCSLIMVSFFPKLLHSPQFHTDLYYVHEMKEN